MLTDISEFHIPAGKVYLSPLIDCFDGKVVSWTIGVRTDAQLVNTMLDAAIETIDCASRPVVHSDRGAYYRWPGWLARIADAELTRSMSCKGCSPDNAACEGFFERLKTEWFYPGKWQSSTVEQFTQALHSYIRWYNDKRIKIALGARSLIDYRRSLGLTALLVQEIRCTPTGLFSSRRQHIMGKPRQDLQGNSVICRTTLLTAHHLQPKRFQYISDLKIAQGRLQKLTM